MFSAIRQGSPIYILEKGDVPSLKIGQVISVGNPTPKYNTTTAGVGIGITPEMVIDIRAKADEQEYDFKQLPSAQSIANYGNAVVSDSREAMLAEVDGMRQSSQLAIDKVEYHKGVVEACEEMLKTLNPNYAKEQARDEAISDLTKRLTTFERTLTNIEKLLSKSGKS